MSFVLDGRNTLPTPSLSLLCSAWGEEVSGQPETHQSAKQSTSDFWGGGAVSRSMQR